MFLSSGTGDNRTRRFQRSTDLCLERGFSGQFPSTPRELADAGSITDPALSQVLLDKSICDSTPVEFMGSGKSVCKSVLEYHDLAKSWDIGGPSNVFAAATAIDEDS